MQLVLLSGGSGKRLWPLSNNARSKQFLPLLEREDATQAASQAVASQEGKEQGRTTCAEGTRSMESMVQRVVRQVREAGLTDQITLATNASQLDIITNQLGDTVSVVTEPERRDTFPAIALAASYLSLEKQCPDDEVVVIMPCDPYTQAGYFSTIGRMVQCVQQDVAQLVLMGITPTYPSEKYGYVVPQAQDSSFKIQVSSQPETLNLQHETGSTGCLPVARFTEKPTTAVAQELLQQGALWNGGVFAFRLGYIMNIVRRYITSASFSDTRARYSQFPKISFDYEVAERAQSVAVVPYTGQWKDLGTWNTYRTAC